ncbi:MAG: NAD-dependent epimerase/dehydratase family protein [archaeon]
MTIKNILVAGSSGTIGTRLCEKLLENKYNVIGIDIKKNKWNKTIDNLTIKLDLKDNKTTLKKLKEKNIDLIICLAANPHVYSSVKNPLIAKENIDIIFNVLELARINRIKRIMFSSSREIYGCCNKLKKCEEDFDIKNCESPYGASKVAGEALIHSYNKCYNIDYIIYRLSNVYGMYDDLTRSLPRVIPIFITKLKANEDINVYGKTKGYDFTYIDDCINAIILGIEKFENAKNNTYNIASGKETKILEIAHKLKRSLKSNSKIIIKENRIGEILSYNADISKAKKILGYKPLTSINIGIKKTIDWYLKNIKL